MRTHNCGELDINNLNETNESSNDDDILLIVLLIVVPITIILIIICVYVNCYNYIEKRIKVLNNLCSMIFFIFSIKICFEI